MQTKPIPLYGRNARRDCREAKAGRRRRCDGLKEMAMQVQMRFQGNGSIVREMLTPRNKVMYPHLRRCASNREGVTVWPTILLCNLSSFSEGRNIINQVCQMMGELKHQKVDRIAFFSANFSTHQYDSTCVTLKGSPNAFRLMRVRSGHHDPSPIVL